MIDQEAEAHMVHDIDRLRQFMEKVLDDTPQHQPDTYRLGSRYCDLVAVLYEVVEAQRWRWPLRTIVLDHGTDESMWVAADAQHILRVVSTYLAETLHTSAADQALQVQLEVVGEIAFIWVHTRETGLPIYRQESSLERVYHGDSTTQQTNVGRDRELDLYLSRTRITQSYGQTYGEVGVESIPGRGTTFWYALPLASSVPGNREH